MAKSPDFVPVTGGEPLAKEFVRDDLDELRNLKDQLVQTSLVLLLLALATPASADDQTVAKGDRAKAIQGYVDQVHHAVGFSGVVLAAREGKIVATVAIGALNQKPDSDRLTSQSLFEIASCTKPFTAIAVLQLAERGRLSLDDTIDKHLPNVPPHSRAITIRQLLSHTSGIPGTNTVGAGDDIDKVLPTFLDGGPRHAPGSRFQYWNQGYAILSEVIARASGKSYTEYVRDNIFRPCAMTQSCFTGDPPRPGSSVAVGTSARDKPRAALEHPYGSYGFQYRGMGGLVTNVEDLWRWDRSLRHGKLIKVASFNEMIAAGKGGYGLGWFIADDPDGSSYHRHGGSVRGFRAEIRRYPSIDGAIFVVANQDETLPISLVTYGVEQLLFGRSPNLQFPKPPTAALVDAAAGKYENSKNQVLTIAKSSGLPSVTIDWNGPVTAGYLGLDDNGSPRLYMLGYSNNRPHFKDEGELEFSNDPTAPDHVSLLLPGQKLTFRRVAE